VIRKILFFVVLVYTALWFSVAYTIKSNLINTINNSETDNFKVSYSQIKVFGFPTRLQIGIMNPKIKFINHINSEEISAEKIILLPNFNFKTAKLSLGQEVKQENNFNNTSTQYNIQSKEDILVQIEFNKPLYRLSDRDSIKSIIKFLQVNNNLLNVISDNKEIFNIADLSCSISKTKSLNDEDVAIQLHLLYDSKEDFFSFKSAKLDLSTLINIASDQNHEINTIRNLKIDHLILACDNDSQIDLVGSLRFVDSKLPQGKLSFELVNYHGIIDKLMPNNLIIPKKMLKTIIEKYVKLSLAEAVKTDDNEVSTYEKIKFDIEFSDNGIHIGSMNLLEFKLGTDDQLEDEIKLDDNVLQEKLQ
jgi:hypothetical protein